MEDTSSLIKVEAFQSVHCMIHAAIASHGTRATLRQVYEACQLRGRILYKRSGGSRLITHNEHWKSQIRHALYTSGRFCRVPDSPDLWQVAPTHAHVVPATTVIAISAAEAAESSHSPPKRKAKKPVSPIHAGAVPKRKRTRNARAGPAAPRKSPPPAEAAAAGEAAAAAAASGAGPPPAAPAAAPAGRDITVFVDPVTQKAWTIAAFMEEGDIPVSQLRSLTAEERSAFHQMLQTYDANFATHIASLMAAEEGKAMHNIKVRGVVKIMITTFLQSVFAHRRGGPMKENVKGPPAGVEGACDRVTHSAQSAHTVMKPAPLHVVAAKDTVDSNRRLKVLEH